MKKLISLIIVIATVASLVCLAVTADGETIPPQTDTEASAPSTDAEEIPPEEEAPKPIEEGTFGESFTWAYYEDATLVITGDGAMPDFESYAHQPWRHLASSVKKVTLSENVTRVGAYAFALMPVLSTVELPKQLDVIGARAFEKCYAVKFIDLPSAISRIEEGAFADCWQLATIDLALNASYLNFLGDEAFAGCSSLRTITMPRRLRHIGESAFAGCSSLNGITLPDGLTYLGRFAFQACSSLKSVNVPYKLAEIPDYAFFACTSLENVTVGRNLSRIGKEAFLWCPSLKEMYLPAGVTDIPAYSIGYYYFNREYVRYDGVTIISGAPAVMSYATENGFGLVVDETAHICAAPCAYCARCTSECEFFRCYDKCMGHTFPETGEVNESITWSFSEDFVLTLSGTGDMPDFKYDSIPWGEYRASVRKLVLSDGITSVGDFAFDSHSSLCDVTLPEGITRIGRKAFALCESLVIVTVPDTVKEIDEFAFNGCTSLEEVAFGAGVEAVGYFAFNGCVSLTEVTLPEGMLTVGESAFEGCAELTTVYVPASVTDIGLFAFGYLFSEDRYYFKKEDILIKAPLFSAGETYAVENGFAYERSDTHECEYLCEVCSRCLDTECRYPECVRKCDGICTAEWENPFTDVRVKDWFSDSVRYVYLKGLFTGMTNDTFVPSGSVTRAQLTVVLWRLAGAPEASADTPFTDLTASWYKDAVSWAYGAGVVTGKTATEFDPMGDITREQMMTMLMRFTAKIQGADTSARGELDGFADSAEISSYAVDAISWGLASGLLTGKEEGSVKYVSPLTGATRAECATVFARFLRM